jgi:DNA-binding beta-propeller fold protein YncE
MTDSDAVAYSADRTRAFVTTRRTGFNTGSDLVTTTITDAASGAAVGQSVTVNEEHSGFRYNDDGSRLYVYESLGNSSKVTIIDTASGTATVPIFVDGCCPRLTFSDDGVLAIVTTTGCDGNDDESRVAFIDIETGELVSAGSAASGAQPQGQQ